MIIYFECLLCNIATEDEVHIEGNPSEIYGEKLMGSILIMSK